MSKELLPSGTARNLSNNLYDKRKLGALEVEQIVKELHSNNDKVIYSYKYKILVLYEIKNEKCFSLFLFSLFIFLCDFYFSNQKDGIKALIKKLNDEFVQSSNGNSKKGGLVSLAGNIC